MASRKDLEEEMSGRALEMRGAILAVIDSERSVAVESMMFSSMRKAAAWMALQAAGGTLGIVAAVRRIRMILDRLYGSSESIHSWLSSHRLASDALQTGPVLVLARMSA